MKEICKSCKLRETCPQDKVEILPYPEVSREYCKEYQSDLKEIGHDILKKGWDTNNPYMMDAGLNLLDHE